MSECGSVRIGDAGIEYEVRRSARRTKTVQITVEGGRVRVAAPVTTTNADLRAIVRRRAQWILERLSAQHAGGRPAGSAPDGPVTDRGSVRFGDKTIEYEVRRSARRRKTIGIRVHDGLVHLAAPAATPDSELQAIVLKRARWILERLSMEVPRPQVRRLVSGETLPYMGRDIVLAVEPGDVASPAVRFGSRGLRVTVPSALGGDERYDIIRREVTGWYWERAAGLLPEIVERWWPRLGRGGGHRVLIRDQRRRWGSCARDGTLRFSWRVMMLRPDLIELIVVHELAHLTHPNHSPDFWDLVYTVLPSAPELRRTLRQTEPTLPLLSP